MARLDTLARQIAETEKKLWALRKEHCELEIANCDHDWSNVGYVNGHTGDDVDVWRCNHCAYRTSKNPDA